MSTVVHIRKRGKFSKSNNAKHSGSSSHNTRLVQYKPVLPSSSKYRTREPKRFKTKSKYENSYKNHQQRLLNRIFGRDAAQFENHYGITEEGQKSNITAGNNMSTNMNRPPLHRKPSNDPPSTNVDSGRDNTKSENAKPKDFEVKLERALLDLSHHKNNFYKDKSEFDKQIEQTKKDKDARMRQTFYGAGPYPGSHNVLSNGSSDMAVSNGNGYYPPPLGYATGTRFRPSTHDSSFKKTSIPTDGLGDGGILSKIDSISNDELKERLVVAEMIMK